MFETSVTMYIVSAVRSATTMNTRPKLRSAYDYGFRAKSFAFSGSNSSRGTLLTRTGLCRHSAVVGVLWGVSMISTCIIFFYACDNG
jgi:hypothetical protein